ncbi:DNA excision repair protein ERCC-6-like 2 [Pimephales promelas]|uniref:DNA excision repair protein ERCC-6-like 2 n=1 Tax=Pimephales promelas TaxID=90988 RepID=UPI00195592B5|nr:DNA excision repair protein ERCC-6-like 2 [Pimephales promelas]XP_039535924.1 DNA excision repair protein ERCC-6-like 2 [Pimephales promelas]XP_039535931.1 DNA excision repair protein ERCC-6-like 2 [Pimephales promelas]
MEMEEEGSSTKGWNAKTSSPQFEDERPLFHSNQSPLGTSEPFLLPGSDVKVPYTINRYLRDYQREGIRFIYRNYAKSRGCILGDDMGLGKTVQVIGFLAAVLQKTGTWKDVENNRPQFLLSQKPSEQVQKVFLIVAPLSVLYNWKDELDTWGHFRVVVVHGVRKDEELARVQRGRCEIALTTYETLRLCLDEFNSIDWASVIVDEAHKIKNHRSQITQAMKEMRCKVRVGLTGTVLQNNLEELWCVMDWAIPGCLGSLGGFKNRFSDPIEQGQKHTVTKRGLAEGRKAVQELAKKLSHWFLRRTKAIISDQLPKKDDRVVYCSLTDFQRTVYRAVLDTDDVNLLLLSSGKCRCGSGRLRKKCCYKLNADGVPIRNLYFSYLAILRKVANHVALLQSKEGTSKKQEKYVTAICEQVFKKFPDFTERCKQAAFEAMSDPMYSGKMKVLQKLLNHFIAKKDKVLLFSLSTKLLDVLESYCMAEGLEYHRLDGNTKSKDRVKIVREFNSSRDVNLCLVSTLAGGLGLNFIGANVVILFDPTWNPANDLQAIDRAYRIGQCRDVTVFRLISLGTVEEIIYLRQIYKQQLQLSVIGQENARRYFEAVQGTDSKAGELFGTRNLFRLQTDGTCLTHRILEREGQVEVGIMTARTQALDERMEEPDPRSADAATERTGGSAGSGLKTAGVLDFSSASEDEDPCCSRPSETHTGEQTGAGTSCIGNMGLYSVLQKQMTQRGLQETDSEEDFSQSQDEDNYEKPTTIKGQASKTLDLSIESEEGMDDKPQRISEVSADLELLPPRSHKHNNDSTTGGKNHVHKRVKFADKRSEVDIESFSSSEDEVPQKNVRCMKGPSQENKSTHKDNTTQMSFGKKSRNALGCNKTQSRDAGNTGTLDSLLGGLQHVSYTHSNQKVVGSSRAEDRLSRAAVRDVFELNKHSQLPANQILDSSETSTQASDPLLADHSDGGQTPLAFGRPHMEHPVTHTIKTSYHQNDVTIIVGETPSSMCRQQLEEMAQFFGFDTVRDFADDILKNDSEQRLSRLRSYYSQESLELKNIAEKTFPKPNVGLKPPTSPPPSTARQRTTSKRAHRKSPLKPQVEVPTLEVEDQREPSKKKRVDKPETSEVHVHCSTDLTNNKMKMSSPDKEPSSSSRHLSQRCSAPVEETKTNIIGSSQPFKNKKYTSRSLLVSTDDCAASGSTQTSGSSKITDLIGDTSILNDLFKSKKKTLDQPKDVKTSTCTERAKSRGKDFWDILNEGNVESINKLTDLTEVEKICNSVSVSAKFKSNEKTESSQLWKKNEKFLWKH